MSQEIFPPLRMRHPPTDSPTVVVYADEAGSCDAGNRDPSVFLASALIALDDAIFKGLDQEVRALWSAGKLRQVKGRKATDAELDTFVDLLSRHDAFPSIAYIEKNDDFFVRFSTKAEKLNALDLQTLRATRANARYTPRRGHSPSMLLWSYAVPMAIGMGLGVLVSRGLHIGAIEAHIDPLELPETTKNLVLDQTSTILRDNLLEQVRATYVKLGLASDHLGQSPDRVSVNFSGTRAGRFLADYLCTVGLRGLNGARPDKRDSRWLNRLSRLHSVLIEANVTNAVLQPLPPMR